MYLYSFFSAGRYIYLYIYIYELWVYGPDLIPARWLFRSVAALVPFGSLRTVGRRCRLFSCQGAVGRIWSPHISVNKRGVKSSLAGEVFSWFEKSFHISGHLRGSKSRLLRKNFNPFTNSDIWGSICKPWGDNFFIVLLYIRTFRDPKS